jgi:hypothetical protein
LDLQDHKRFNCSSKMVAPGILQAHPPAVPTSESGPYAAAATLSTEPEPPASVAVGVAGDGMALTCTAAFSSAATAADASSAAAAFASSAADADAAAAANAGPVIAYFFDDPFPMALISANIGVYHKRHRHDERR